MIPVSEEAILKILQEMGLKGEVQQPSGQIAALFPVENREYPMFIRQLHGNELIQILTFIPCAVEAKHMPDLGRFLHMANKELDMPGFCLDEHSATVFYRVVFATLEGKIDEQICKAYIRTSMTISGTFGTIIEALAIGAITINDVLAQLSKQQENEDTAAVAAKPPTAKKRS